MKHLGIFILGALLLASCATNKRAAYIQQVQTDIPTAIEQDYQIRIKPLDRLTVTINSKDRISLFDALAMAGDLTIYGQRENVALIREENGMRTVHYFDLKNPDILTSPYFYLQQDDVVYVTPNKYKAQAGEINQNRSFYISLVSVAVSVATLLVTITR